ncbi:hypothetical protein CDAR_546201 [Caerostris darwini]|uniref:Secreted protein n=1 Tax=Caerostris darwini TaxID=1538125 RepID=A0AAV4VFM9_9ARAC|nr:hypothetical protein CDAR_546201 [Caerostris darwini]
MRFLSGVCGVFALASDCELMCPMPSLRVLASSKKPLTRLCRAPISVCSGQDMDRHAQVSRPNNKMSSAGTDRET